MEPYPVPGRPQALTSSYGLKRLIYWEPDRALPQFSMSNRNGTRGKQTWAASAKRVQLCQPRRPVAHVSVARTSYPFNAITNPMDELHGLTWVDMGRQDLCFRQNSPRFAVRFQRALGDPTSADSRNKADMSFAAAS